MVGFADLWVADEPLPFGRSLNVECIDYFREHYLAGLETILLGEVEPVARRAHLPALDIGTNTSSGDYPALRRFGLRVFHEYDSELYVELEALASAEAMAPLLAECAAVAAQHGADRISLPVPSDLEIGPPLEVLDRRFAYAWMRKRLAAA